MKIVLSKFNFLSSKPAIFLYYVICVLVLTYPWVLDFWTKLLGYNDAWQSVWNFWWVKTALIDLHNNPLFTSYLHWPNGISLLFHTINLSNSLVAVPLQYIFSLTTTYNILLFFNFAFNGFATYFLAYYLTKNKFASFIAGYILAFSPYMFAHAQGHLNLLSFGWLVLFILYFIKMAQNETDWKLPALFLVITGLADWYYFFYLGIIVVFTLFFYSVTNRKIFSKVFIKNLIISLVIGFLILSPYLGAMLYLNIKTHEFDQIVHLPTDYSIDLSAFFLPNVTWFFFKKYFYRFWYIWHWTWENIGFLGYSIIALFLYTLIKIRKKIVYFWVLLVLIFCVLALGPYLQVNGVIYKNFTLPYYYLYKYIPFMTMQGIPARFMSIVYLSLGILAAIAIKDILNIKSKLKYLILGLIMISIFIEYLPTQLKISPVLRPNFYVTLSQDPNDYAILDISDKDYKVLFYQTIHHKRLISGYTSRPSKKTIEFLDETPIISNIYHGIDFTDINFNIEESKNVLIKYSVKYILISSSDKNRSKIISKLELPIIFQNNTRTIYQVY